MKKIQFIISAVAMTFICLCFILFTVTSVAGFVFQYEWTRDIDLGSCTAFAVVFLLVGHIFAPTVRGCWEEYKYKDKDCSFSTASLMQLKREIDKINK